MSNRKANIYVVEWTGSDSFGGDIYTTIERSKNPFQFIVDDRLKEEKQVFTTTSGDTFKVVLMKKNPNREIKDETDYFFTIKRQPIGGKRKTRKASRKGKKTRKGTRRV